LVFLHHLLTIARSVPGRNLSMSLYFSKVRVLTLIFHLWTWERGRREHYLVAVPFDFPAQGRACEYLVHEISM